MYRQAIFCNLSRVVEVVWVSAMVVWGVFATAVAVWGVVEIVWIFGVNYQTKSG